MRSLLKRCSTILLAAGLFFGTIAVRATLEQMHAFDDGIAAESAGDVDRAITEYRWALRWYTPWGPRHDDAAARLVAIADATEKDDPERAGRALDALRSGLIACRWLMQPRADLVESVNARIAPILARVAERQGRKDARADVEARVAAAYARPVGVSPLVSLGVSLGFLAWIAGLLLFVRRGVDAGGHLVKPAAWRYLALALCGFLTWFAAMWLG